MRASVIVVADGDHDLASEITEELGDRIREHRQHWTTKPVAVKGAIAQGQTIGRYPILLADHAGNTGGGSPGDSTEILRTFPELDLDEAILLYMVDPEVVEMARAAGAGKTISIAVGGKSEANQGPPVSMEAQVMAVSVGDFTYDGPMYAGLTGNMRGSAWLKPVGTIPLLL